MRRVLSPGDVWRTLAVTLPPPPPRKRARPERRKLKVTKESTKRACIDKSLKKQPISKRQFQRAVSSQSPKTLPNYIHFSFQFAPIPVVRITLYMPESSSLTAATVIRLPGTVPDPVIL